jgi:hypothetical protein
MSDLYYLNSRKKGQSHRMFAYRFVFILLSRRYYTYNQGYHVLYPTLPKQELLLDMLSRLLHVQRKQI